MIRLKIQPGYLMDIVYDGNTGGSELCIWDAAGLQPPATKEQHTDDVNAPVARIHLPHRVPYGVHANWLSTEELLLQHNWFQRD